VIGRKERCVAEQEPVEFSRGGIKTSYRALVRGTNGSCIGNSSRQSVDLGRGSLQENLNDHVKTQPWKEPTQIGTLLGIGELSSPQGSQRRGLSREERK